MRLRGTLSLLPLIGYRLLQRARLAGDEQGGLARFESSERRRLEAGFLAEQTMPSWLGREGAGRLWLRPASARRWARRSCSPEDQAWAEAVVAGRWSLLGAAESVGSPPAWRRDLYSGVEWPLERSSQIPLVRGDGSDIRTVWELSRSYHFVVLAKAFWRTGEARFARTFREHVESWLETNPVGRGPNWRSPMDAAIRAANWVIATSLFAEAENLPSEFWSRLLANLRVTAHFVDRHLEWHPLYRGNHFISNAVGLVYVGALFREDPAGRRWLARGARILRREMELQVSQDGVSCEAALGYHRLVTEFFSYGGAVCERNGHPLPAAYWNRLRA
ncbi:MAG TPA: heparinase II/III family protein, partial [Gemmatimonadales bacterium]|nr:heparinase II/III family protein [Gemmatimonadales bacterium]